LNISEDLSEEMLIELSLRTERFVKGLLLGQAWGNESSLEFAQRR
jgi:hypothetical protein